MSDVEETFGRVDWAQGHMSAREKAIARLPATYRRPGKKTPPPCRLCGSTKCRASGADHCKICTLPKPDCIGHWNLRLVRGFISPATRFYGGSPRPRDVERVVADAQRAGIEYREALSREAAQNDA